MGLKPSNGRKLDFEWSMEWTGTIRGVDHGTFEVGVAGRVYLSERERLYSMNEGDKRLEVHDDPGVRETYANQMVSASFDGGSLILTLGVRRHIPKCVGEPIKQCPVLVTERLVITPSVAAEIINSLQELLAIASRRSATVPNQGPAPLVGHPGKMN